MHFIPTQTKHAFFVMRRCHGLCEFVISDQEPSHFRCDNTYFLLLLRLKGRRRRDNPAALEINVLHHELDYFDISRILWNGIHFLSWPRKVGKRHWMVVVDRRFFAVFGVEHGASCQGHADASHWYSLPCVDRHRGSGHGSLGHFRIPRARHILAAFLHHHSDNLYCGTETTLLGKYSVIWNFLSLFRLK